jgi:alpha-beta hydrolase superfamily lysophospholipase
MKEQLLSADIHSNGLVEDVYLITPNNSGDGSVQLAVTHLSTQNRKPGTPVVLVHGQFTNRSVWFDHGGSGFAEYLTGLGYDVWMPEMRGHGLSPENQRFQYNSMMDYINYDLPALQQYLATRVEHPAIWFGYGLSGIALSAALALDNMNSDLLNGLVLLNLDDPRGAWRSHSLSRLLNWRERKRGYIEADVPSGNLEPEAYGIIHGDFNPLKPASGLASNARQQNFKRKLADLSLPLLMLAGPELDTNHSLDAEKVFRCWGGSQKTLIRYRDANTEHAMIRSQYARSHVWKDIEQWLAELYTAGFEFVRSA